MVSPVTRRTRALRARQKALSAAQSEAGGMPPEVEARLLVDPGYFVETCLHVRHIDGGRTVPFALSAGQRVVAAEVKRGLDAGEAVRLVVLKSRRQMISSFCEALGYWATSTRPYVEGLVLAHKQEVTEEIFQLVDGFYLTDERKHFGRRPATENSNRRELRFGNPDKRLRDADPGLQSGLRVTSADAKEPGRAGTYHFVHASEVAYWSSDEVWQSVGIALTNAPGTIAVQESTANGQAGLFYETYWGAKAGYGASPDRRRGKNEYTAIFLAWWMDPRNQLVIRPEDLALFDYETAEEQRLAERFKLTPGQVLWRRHTIESPICFKPGVSRQDVFKQEYPSDDEEAFLTSGKHFFLLPKVKELEEHPAKGVKAPLLVGEIVQEGRPLEERGPHARFPVKPKFEADPGGSLRVWSPPNRLHPHLIVVDPAEGLQDGDESVVYVLDRVLFEWVAVWAGTHKSARELAWTACLLGWWYGTGLLVVEHNNHGLATIEEARRIVYPTLWNHVDVTRPGSDPTDKVGWVTSGATRQYALMNLEAEIRAGLMGMHDPVFYEQARNFVWPEKRLTATGTSSPTPRARAGTHDDRIMCAAIGLAVHMNAGLAKPRTPEPESAGGPLVPDARPQTFAGAVEAKQKRRIGAGGRAIWGSHGRR